MARWILVSFFVACLLCFVQAFPQTDTAEAQPTTASNIETALNGLMESVQKGIKGIMEDPNVSKLVKDGQKALENAAETIRTEAAKIMPKTDK